jgi:hypothetical protein
MRKKFWLPWYQINTDPSWVLRELVDEVHCTFDDDDFSELLLELDKPFDELAQEDYVSDKDNLARDYPLKHLNQSGWQKQNLTADSRGLDSVESVENIDDDFEALQQELSSGNVDRALVPLSLATQVTETETNVWMDINDSFNDNLVRDEAQVDLSNQDLGANFDDLVAELNEDIKVTDNNECIHHSGFLMIKGRGTPEGEENNDEWKKSFFILTEKNNKTFAVDFFDKEGGVLQGSIYCRGSQVMSSTDDRHGICIRSVSGDTPITWCLKADSAESQYKWVAMFTKVCCSIDIDDEIDEEIDENQVDVIIEEETTFL